MLQTPDL